MRSHKDQAEIAAHFYEDEEQYSNLLGVGLLLGASLVASLFMWQFLLVAAYIVIADIVITIVDPENEVSLVYTKKMAERLRLRNLFVDALATEGAIDSLTKDDDIFLECLSATDPYTFRFRSTQPGITRKRIELTVSSSLIAFQAIRGTVDEEEDGYFLIRYWKTTEADYLGKMAVPYEELPIGDIDIGHIPIGRYSNGEVCYLSMFEANLLMGGSPRSGKSVSLNTILLGLCRCMDRIIICSPKILDFQHFSPRCELLQEPADILAMLKSLQDVVAERKKYCLENGLKKIEDFTPAMPHYTIVVDEFTVLKLSTTVDEKGKTVKIGEQIEAEIMKLVAEASFSGIQFICATQRCSASNITTNLRDLLNQRIGFATETKESTTMIFGSTVALCHELTTKHRGVGYAAVDGNKPRIFKGALPGKNDEKDIPKETAHIRQEIEDYRRGIIWNGSQEFSQ